MSLSPALYKWNLLASSGECCAFQGSCVGRVLARVRVSLRSTEVAASPRPAKAQRAASACLWPADPGRPGDLSASHAAGPRWQPFLSLC